MSAASTLPVPSITIKIGDETREFTMSFGLLNELATLVPAYERIPDISFDAETRSAVFEACLVRRDERGPPIKDDDGPNMNLLTIEDGEAILSLIAEHLADFFLGRLEKQLTGIKAHGARLTAVGSSLTGLAASAAKTP